LTTRPSVYSARLGKFFGPTIGRCIRWGFRRALGDAGRLTAAQSSVNQSESTEEKCVGCSEPGHRGEGKVRAAAETSPVGGNTMVTFAIP
jgi:hypothetical protein